MAPIVTLTTDFGSVDPFVAALKGVLLTRAPDLRIVDVSHEVPPHDVLRGAFVVDGAARWFPPGTVHVAVVDPGVGTSRDLAVVEAGGHVFLAPDNGLLTLVLRRWPDARARQVADHAFDLPEVSSTFHGRDRLAPLAAALAAGCVCPAELGPSASLVRLPDLDARVTQGRVEGRVLFPDRFGNLVTTVTRADATAAFGDAAFVATLGPHALGAVAATYASGAGRGLFPIWGSEGRLEVSTTEGSAASGVERTLWQQLVLTGPACPARAPDED